LRSAGANPTEEQLNEMVTEADTNKNGVIEFDEFVNLVARLQATLAR
jgi:Ca2+-binding EF-hand superfamily protein